MATLAQAIATEVDVKAKEEQMVRFDIHQRIQHILMIASFTVLAFTGLPQKFNTWAISEAWVNFLGGIETVRGVHRFFAWMMLADAVYHMVYLFANSTLRKRPFPVGMVPSLRDLQNVFQEIRYFVGLSRTEPRYDKFNWREKFDYWAVFWGIPILGISGLILMFPVQATRILPGDAVPMALIAHSDEAFLAVAWIFGSHFFFTHLAPGVFPLNKSIFTGRIPLSRLEKEHPLEWERLQAAVQPSFAEFRDAGVAACAPLAGAVEASASLAGEAELLHPPKEIPLAPSQPADEMARAGPQETPSGRPVPAAAPAYRQETFPGEQAPPGQASPLRGNNTG